MANETELYFPDDTCEAGSMCPGEGVVVPQKIGDTELDTAFVGSEADSQADLGLANIDTYPLTDELFPVIFDDALLTLDGLIDCFARKYPERAQLLNALIETQGYRITFDDNPSAAEAELESWLGEYNKTIRSARTNAVSNTDFSEIATMEQHYAQEKRRLDSMRHWRITPGSIYISNRINRNIDINNYLLGDDEDQINHFPTNAEGADWLNAVMGDWMVRSGIPGASRDEEFADSFSSRVTWGTLNVVFGAAEVAGGVALMAASAAGSAVTGGASASGVLAGGAITLAGYEAITQGFDMWKTPQEAEHGAGWLGDGVFAMMNDFGVLDRDDQDAFNRYWSFAMLGLSLGGAGVLGYAGKARQAARAGRAPKLDFITDVPNPGLASAKMAIVGVKDAKFGKLTVSYAPLPSGRVAMNFKGIGRAVAPPWDSTTRVRSRMNIADEEFVQYRRAKLAANEAGLISLRGGIHNSADARKLAEEALEKSGYSAKRFNQFISKVVFAPDARSSSFNIGTRTLTIRGRVGTGTAIVGEYNELKALNEVFHEIQHAVRRYEYVKKNGTLNGYEKITGRGELDPLYAKEEVLVEKSAQALMRKQIEGRIAGHRKFGDSAEADRLQRLLDDAIADSNEYMRIWTKKTGE